MNMMEIKNIVLICAIFALCESLAIDSSKKCSLADSDCLRLLYGNIIRDTAEKGMPEYGIPAFDPFIVKNIDISLLAMFKFTMVDGTAAGLKNCVSNKYISDVENLRHTIDLTCDSYVIEGHYTAEPLPAFTSLAGTINVHGDGKGKVEIEKVHLTFDFPFEFKKLDDGELHIHIKSEETSYTFKVLGKVKFSADNMFVGSQDISDVGTAILNENWEYFVNTFGKDLMDKIMENFFMYADNFFKGVPAKDLLTEDLSKYVKS